ncbi:MAG: hypothetical protein JRJ66_15990 [Deltaproteobacteria bacterium]|nr:hypothetical protein [Deltaproteobacteria bacterium]
MERFPDKDGDLEPPPHRTTILRGWTQKLTEYINIPTALMKELQEGLVRVEEVLATLEELANTEGLERIKTAEEEYQKGDYITLHNSDDIRKKL